MKATRMSELFQIDEINLDSKEDNSPPAVDFSERINDVHAVLEPKPAEVPQPNRDTEIIKSAIKDEIPTNKTPDVTSGSEDDLDIPGDVIEEVAAEIQQFRSKLTPEDKVNPDPVSENEPEVASDLSQQIEIPNKTQCDPDNPLELTGLDLKAYKEIHHRYANVFSLYDGSLSYRDFYKYKVHALRHLLGQFPLLNVAEMRQELSTVKTNHFIGDDNCTPDLIRVKLDSSYAHRARLSSLLTTALAQYYAWERFLDLSRSKLWKDHDVKGAHRRDGMVMEHLSDMESYVASLKGFIESAKQYDAMLRSAADSLSRQLTCLQLNEYAGSQRVETKDTRFGSSHSHLDMPSPTPKIMSQGDHTLDGLDSVQHGTVIGAPNPKPNEAVTTVSYGQEDELSTLG